MSRETISMEDQDTLKACHVLTTNQTLTVPSLLNILSKVPRLVESLATRLEVQYDKTETLRMQVQDLQGKLVQVNGKLVQVNGERHQLQTQWDSERRGMAVMRDKFGAKPEETFPEFVTRLAAERLALQEALQLAQVGGPSHQTLLDEIAKTGELLNKETTTNARLVSNLTAADFKIAEQARTLEHMDLRFRQLLTRADNLDNLLAVASHRAATAEQALRASEDGRDALKAEVNRQSDRANSAEGVNLELRGQLRDMDQARQYARTLHDQALARAEAAERCAARAEQAVDAELRVRMDALEVELRSHKDHPGLPIDVLVHEAYQMAKDKGWHDPADEDDVTVVETWQALCEEGIRSLSLCRIAEMLRKGKKPEVGDYLRLFGGHPYLLTAADTRLVSDLMLVITEVGEAIEDVVFGRLGEKVDEKGKPVGLPTELADVVIRVAHICGHRKIDLTGAIQRKLKFNKTRPHKHGRRA